MGVDPLISVVMPVYNGQRYLREAVKSITTQTHGDFEFIVIDDGSTDDSPAILRTFAKEDARIRIISRPNTGLVGALNDGFAEARGQLIARMDADDISLPQRLERQLRFLKDTPDCVAAGSSHLIITSDGDVIGEMPAESDPDRISEALLAGTSPLAHPTMMIRAEALKQAGGYRAEYAHAEDYDLWLRLDEIGQLRNVPEILFKYRWHFDSICQRQTPIQSRNVIKANAEARRRRGLAPAERGELSAVVAPQRSEAEFLRLCSTIALKHGAYGPALRCILNAAVQQPLKSDNYRLLLRYLIGNRAADRLGTLRGNHQKGFRARNSDIAAVAPQTVE